MSRLNPRVDVPDGENYKTAWKRVVARYPWLETRRMGTGYHTGRGTTWSGGYTTYQLIDPVGGPFSGRLSEAADNIQWAVESARADKWW